MARDGVRASVLTARTRLTLAEILLLFNSPSAPNASIRPSGSPATFLQAPGPGDRRWYPLRRQQPSPPLAHSMKYLIALALAAADGFGPPRYDEQFTVNTVELDLDENQTVARRAGTGSAAPGPRPRRRREVAAVSPRPAPRSARSKRPAARPAIRFARPTRPRNIRAAPRGAAATPPPTVSIGGDPLEVPRRSTSLRA